MPWSSRPSLLWPMPAKVISDRNALSLLLDFSHPIPVPRRLLACPVRQSACVALSPLLYAFLSQRSLLYITSQRGPLTTPFNVTSFSRSFFVCHLGCFQQCINQKLVVQSLSYVQLSVTPCQASLSFAVSWSLLRFMSIELVMLCNHLILCHLLLLLPSVFPSIRVFSNELALRIKWTSISFSISPFSEYSGLVSFWMDGWQQMDVWLDG